MHPSKFDRIHIAQAIRAGTISMAITVLLALWAGAAANCLAMTNEVTLKVDSIRVGRDTFTQVEVFRKTETDVFIRHETGLASFKVESLDEDALVKLGYIEKKSVIPAAAAAEAVAQSSSFLEKFKLSGLSMKTLIPGLVFGILGYLYMCFLFWMICNKVGYKPGLPVWLPFLQIVPLLKAAGMSGSWFVGLVAALAAGVVVTLNFPGFALAGLLIAIVFPVILYAVWSFRICGAREKNPMCGLLLLVPGVNMGALIYLAFSE